MGGNGVIERTYDALNRVISYIDCNGNIINYLHLQCHGLFKNHDFPIVVKEGYSEKQWQNKIVGNCFV